MDKIGAAGQPIRMRAGMFEALSLLFKGLDKPAFGVSAQKPSYSGSTGSFKQNQRKERKISARRRQRRLSR